MHQILHSLLHVYGDSSSIIPCSTKDAGSINASGQVYLNALPLNRQVQISLLKEEIFATNFCQENGDFTFKHLCQQLSPRTLSTHLFGVDLLPTRVLGGQDEEDKEGKGRPIIVLRNLKDVLCSLHFFMHEAKDRWLGN